MALAVRLRQANRAGDVEFHAVADDLARDLGAHGAQEPLHGGVPELPHLTQTVWWWC